MTSKEKSLALRKLSISIGNFIRYWGFRRIHGALWTQVYLSKLPLGCTELAQRLGLSKSLVSPALEELCRFKLIYEVPSSNEKAKHYAASKDVNQIIRQVLKSRETKMMECISKDFIALGRLKNKDESLDEQRFEALGKMIGAASLMLEVLVSQENFLEFPFEAV